ncbi:MAG: penicillin-binding protein 2 [Candidatus Brocadia sp.]|nr:penicillin-binding protein 2 [Candidatus Brocadia sp.]MDG6026711.1 penicillin-binding protein 2 [Candidatus Brocadia sp.]
MMPLKKHKLWANITGALLMIAFLALAVHLSRIQLLDHVKYRTLARGQQNKKIELPARRGSIVDRNGLTLAESLQVSSVYADPAEIEDVRTAAYQISKVLRLNSSKLAKLLRKDKRFVWIKRKITDEELIEITKLALKGVYAKHEYQRFYPNGSLGSHVLGFTNIDEKGIEGIELSFDDELSGEPGYKLINRDALQRQIITPDAEIRLPQHGNHVQLTIDANIQRLTEEELEIACEKWNPLSATAVVMDPMTGEVLAMANVPTYDPNHFRKYSPSARRNLAITDSYEPGSLMKPLVISGAFEHGVTKSDEIIFCEHGKAVIEGRRLSDTHPHGNLTISDIIAQSSNIGMAKVGMRMGNEKMYRYLKQFNFGEKTGIELPGEINGVFHPLKQWSKKYSLISVSIGHEIAVTPLQFITAFCCLPNGGQWIRPKVVKATISNDKKTKEYYRPSQAAERVISSQVARTIMNPILMRVVTDGTGDKANLLEYDVAGKTGTSQKIQSSGGYAHNKHVGSFIAYAPAERPRICVLVMINEPQKGAYYGGTVAAPVVREIILRSLMYLGEEPATFKMAMQ